MRGLLGLLGVLLLCGIVYLPGLGARGFGASEGHRVVPAAEFAERDAWLVPTMFDTPYVRKPQGMPWAIRLSSHTFGWTEFSARLVSALSVTLGALALAGFGTRWFGARSGWAAGAAYALSPVAVATGRAAEIEALHNLFAILAIGLVVELALRRPGRSFARAMIGGPLLGVAVFGALLAKGPAAAPTIIGALIGCAIVARTWKRLITPPVLVGLALATAGALWLGIELSATLARTPPPIVSQSPLAFSFEADRLLGIASLPLSSLASHLPAGFALLLVIGARARSREDQYPIRTARALAIGWLASIVVFMAFGVSNNRYTLPSIGLACLCVPWAINGLAGAFTPRRALLARVATLGSPVVLLVVLLIGAGARNVLVERREAIKSGRGPGVALADALMAETDLPIEIWADELIEARPETLLYAERHAHESGRALRGVWAASWDPIEAEGPSVPTGPKGVARFLLLRRDVDQYGSSELERFVSAGITHLLLPVYDGGVYPDGGANGNTESNEQAYRYPFTVFRVVPE